MASQDRIMAMYAAARTGNLAKVKLLLKVGVPPTSGDTYMTSLQAAARFGHYEVFKTLLAAGAPISDPELLPQVVSWKSPSIEVVNHILREGRPPRDVLDASLRFACNVGNPDVIRALVAAGADVNAIDSVYGYCALTNAIEAGHTATVALLLDEGASVDVRVLDDPNQSAQEQPHKGLTALELACALGHHEIAELLRKIPGVTAKPQRDKPEPDLRTRPISYRCMATRMVHQGLPELQFHLPDEIRELGPERFAAHVTADTDLCRIDRKRFFIRCIMHHAIIGRDDVFGYGIWVEATSKEYQTYEKNFKLEKASHLGPFKGKFANRIPDMPETIGLACLMHLSDVGQRPKVELIASAQHPLSLEQVSGIPLERAIALAQMMPDVEVLLPSCSQVR